MVQERKWRGVVRYHWIIPAVKANRSRQGIKGTHGTYTDTLPYPLFTSYLIVCTYCLRCVGLGDTPLWCRGEVVGAN